MASIRKRGKTSYQITVSNGYDINGKKLSETKTVKRPAGLTDKQWEKELQKLALEFEMQVETGQYLDGSKMTFAEFTQRWLTSYAEPELAPKTVFRYKEMLDSRILLAIGHIKLDKLQPTHLLDFYENLREEGMRLDTKYIATDAFKEIYRKEKLTQKKLAKLTDISENTASRIVNGHTVTRKTAQKVSKALEYELEVLFKPSGKTGKLSNNSILHHHRLISSILQDAVEWQAILSNPADRVKAPSADKTKVPYYDGEQTKQLLEALETEELKYQVMVLISIFSGVRIGELMGLSWPDIDFENNTIEIRKASQYLPGKGTFEKGTKTETSVRKISMPTLVMSITKEYRKWWIEQKLACGNLWQGSDRLFVTWNGEPMFTYTLTNWFPKFLKRHNLPKITPHGLRHSMTSILDEQGVTVSAISKRLGHARISTTQNIYTHIFKKTDTVASDALENALIKTKNHKDIKQG